MSFGLVITVSILVLIVTGSVLLLSRYMSFVEAIRQIRNNSYSENIMLKNRKYQNFSRSRYFDGGKNSYYVDPSGKKIKILDFCVDQNIRPEDIIIDIPVKDVKVLNKRD